MQTLSWNEVVAYGNSRLKTLSASLEAESSEVLTSRIRGQIRELRLLLALGTETAQIDVVETPSY